MHNFRVALFSCALIAGLLGISPAALAAARPQEAGGGTTTLNRAASDEKMNEKRKRQPRSETLDLSSDPSAVDHSLRGLTKDFLIDQKAIWTSPAHVRRSDVDWLVPASGLAAGLFVTDRDFSTHLSKNTQTINHYKTLSNAGIAALVGGAGGLFLLSYPAHNEHWRETGFLAGEAAVASLIPIEAMKYSLRRQRPFEGDGSGPFFQGGTSFPSEHAAAAWAVAGVIAHEYPGPLPKLAAYGMASLVTYSRLRGHQHFPSDVFIGSLIGNLVAQNVYRRHHNPDLGGGEWRSIGEIVWGDGDLSPANQGSPYVPLDSWVYPALDRLIALGVIDSGFEGMRPWTRLECARLVSEAGDQLEASGGGEQAEQIYRVVENEFREELEQTNVANLRVRIESVYARGTGIFRTPLTNGYVFGQTIVNDYGRPYQRGFNAIGGFSAWTSYGRWVGYVRAEVQHSPSATPLPQSAREVIAELALPIVPAVPPATRFPSVNHLQLLDAYAGLNLNNFQVTFGQQSHWWGAGEGGPMMFSDNSAPINMFRIDRVSPFKLPSILGWLGPMRVEFFLGQLTGQQFLLSPMGLVGQFGQSYNPQPIIHGQKLSFKPSPNLEFAVSRTVIYGGPGYPLTVHTFLRSLFSAGNGNPGSANKPGDRRSGVDLKYRIPGARRWLSFYADGFTEDQYSPVAYADRSVWHAGLYLSHVPMVPKLDFRVEGSYTDNPLGGRICCGYFYYNATWRGGYTNNDHLIGSWVGRDGQGGQAWSNYWFTPKSRIQANFRHQKVSQELLPGGGTLTDGGVQADIWTSSDFSFSAKLQYETWNFPVIRKGQQSDVSASLQVNFWPSRWRFEKAVN